MFVSKNPYNNELIESFSTLSRDEMLIQLTESHNTYREFWRVLSVETRIGYIKQFATVLESEKERLARLITNEMGKPISQSRAEIDKCIWLCDYTSEHAIELLRPQMVHTENLKSYVDYQPLGVILGIMPWNYPLWQALRFAIPTLLAGNTVILKPAPNVSLCSQAIQEIFDRIIPESGVFTTMLIALPELAKMIRNPHLKGVTFTGSDKAGAAVASLAGANIKKCVLELGGSDAFIVLPDADITAAANAAVTSRMLNSGQTCISAKRFIVHELVVEEFKSELHNAFMQLKRGNPMDEETSIGPLARYDLVTRLDEQVKESIEMGAEVLIEGGPMPHSNFYRPMLLGGIRPGMPAYEEELFGPVASLLTVESTEEAIATANDTQYGLGASIWSKDIRTAEMLAKDIEAGAVAINDIVKSDPRLPFGGCKRSGFGREMAKEGILEFVNIKSVVIV